MLPELLRFSSASRLLELIPEELQNVHRTDAPVANTFAVATSASSANVWDGWADARESDELAHDHADDWDDDLDLTDMGL